LTSVENERAACERLQALEGRWDAILAGRDEPQDADGWLDVADLATIRAWHAMAARSWTRAFAIAPDRAEDPDDDQRLRAARSAARAGCGRSEDPPAPDEAARAALRQQALEWLRAELAARAERERATAHPEERDDLRGELAFWQAEPDLAGVRDAEALKALP